MTILGYGVIVISNIDNVFRFVLQKKFADVHPVITVMGVIIGLNWFGIVGIIYGPLMISFFLIMLKIYRVQYLKPESTPSEGTIEPQNEEV
jgi:predicted PurR-regulated permease PerM